MYCPRLNHFVRLNQNGSIGKCGHMTNAIGFKTFKELDESEWLDNIKEQMSNDKWPDQCVRCKQTEEISGESIRTKSIERHKVLHKFKDDYLVVGGVLDNVCNSACQSCNAGLSTKIGSLTSKEYPRVNNIENFYKLPQDRILEVDVNGGEPTASKNYKKILADLPSNTKIVRMNTNGSRMIKELEAILTKRIMVIVTLSFDGTGDVHDYVRWPIKWKNYIKIKQANGQTIMSSLLEMTNIKLKENDFIIIETNSKSNKNEIIKEMASILSYLKESLNNYKIKFVVNIISNDRSKAIFTSKEKYDYLKDLNPDIKLLINEFKIQL